MKSLIRITLSIICILLGIVITPLPLPLGLLLISLGLIILAYDNKRVSRYIRMIRKKFPGLSQKLILIESKNIFLVSEVLQRTNPTNNATDSDF